MENKSHRRVHKKHLGLIGAIIGGIFGLALVGCIVAVFCYEPTTIAENIYVHELHLGGMTVNDAVAALESEFGSDYFDKDISVGYKGEEFEINLLDSVRIDARDTANDALGRSDNLLSRIFGKAKVVIPFDLEVDDDKIEMALARKVASKEEYGVFDFGDDFTSVKIDASKVDEIMDTEKTAELIEKNVENNTFAPVKAVMISKTNEDFAEELYKLISRPAVNASIAMNEDGSTYIVPEQMGIRADDDLFEELYKRHNGVFTMDVVAFEPEILSTELDIDFYQDVLGQYTTKYDPGLVNRTKNVTLATSLIDGTIIMPGHRFSYNGVVGKRSYERGFVDATVYTSEGTEEGIGGGICQVSSTLYCAQLRADLKTVSRTNHSYTVVYVPYGEDATVVYGAIDYIFENDTNYPVKIVANANGGYLNVKILGTKADKSLTVDVVSVTESTKPFEEVRKETDELPAGTTKVDQNGQVGANVSTYKIYYKNGIEQKRELVSKSYYKALNKVVLVGTGEVAEPVDGEVTESPDVTESAGVQTEEEDVTDLPVIEEPTEEVPVVEETAVEEVVPELSDTGL